MKSVIPFTKELDFSTKVSEITSISLEREFEVKETSVVGNLFVTGDYKSHEVSANVIPFSFKIPFTIEIPDHLKEDSITLEISDFAYDMEDNNKIKVNIELELEGMEEEIEEVVEEEVPVEVDTEELLKMMEEREEIIPLEEIEETEVINERMDDEIIEDIEEVTEEIVEDQESRDGAMKESEEMIIKNVQTNDDEYATYHIHIVKEGETVETICTMYNSNLSILGDYNNMSEVTPGSKVIIPKDYES